eukprot:3217161-Alexandrium_andersonii.AAC.1
MSSVRRTVQAGAPLGPEPRSRAGALIPGWTLHAGALHFDQAPPLQGLSKAPELCNPGPELQTQAG